MHPLQSLLDALRAAGVEITMRVLKRDMTLGRFKAAKVGGKYWVTPESVRGYLPTLPADWRP
jgi:hypothetical protein